MASGTTARQVTQGCTTMGAQQQHQFVAEQDSQYPPYMLQRQYRKRDEEVSIGLVQTTKSNKVSSSVNTSVYFIIS